MATGVRGNVSETRGTSLRELDISNNLFLPKRCYLNLHCALPCSALVKRWPTDLAAPGSSPARGKIFSTVNGVPVYTAFYYHSPIVLIWLKYC